MAKKILFLVMIVLLGNLAYAYTLNSFSDSTTSGSLTFTAGMSLYKNISIPYWASVTGAEIDLTGNNLSTNWTSNITIRTSNQITYQNYSSLYNFTGTVQNIDLNKSSLQSCINNKEFVDYPDSELITAYNFEGSGYGIVYTEWFAQPLTLTSSSYISYVTLKMYGSTTDANLTVRIYDNLDNKPNNLLLNTVLSNYSIPIISTEINVTLQPLLLSSGSYWLVTGVPNEASDDVKLMLSTDSTLTALKSVNQGSTWTSGGRAIGFKLYTNTAYNYLCTLNFTSSTAGILEYSGIEVNYDDFFLDNCSNSTSQVLRISGKDEETDALVNLSLNIYMYPTSSFTSGLNLTYQLSGSTSYTFCAKNNNTNLAVDAIMEYADGSIYAKRKYYLNNYSFDTSSISDIYLYHLNASKASEIVFTVYNSQTGEKVGNTYIKVQRYYPEDNVYRIVEIDKTDETGKTLGKMVLADVFYKFILENPAGTVRLNTDVLRILALTRDFSISFAEDYLATWNKVGDVSSSTTCTKGTATCRVTWSDAGNIVRDVTLEVWSDNGLGDSLLSSQTTSSASGTIVYTIAGDTTDQKYIAKSYLSTSAGEQYSLGEADIDYPDNPLFNQPSDRKASLLPLLLLMVVLIFALIDFGTVGVAIGALLGLVIGSVTHIMPISPFYFISFIIIGGILIFKLR